MRHVLRRLALALALIAAPLPVLAGEPTGRALPGLEAFDAAMFRLIQQWGIPGAGLAVAWQGRIVLARGYGAASFERQRPVLPNSQFRIGSLNKMMTAAAILLLVEEGRLALDDKVLPILGPLGPRPDEIRDARVHDITVRQLLHHRAGFDRAQSRDPMFPTRDVEAVRRQGASFPPTCETMLRDVLEQRLDFTPGGRYAYSNIGYCMLGRVVERLSGMAFNEFVRTRLTEPAGAGAMRPGRTVEPYPDEVTYYQFPVEYVTPTPGLGLSGRVLWAYGGYSVEALDAVGQWIAAPRDFLRVMLAIDGRWPQSLLKPESVREMRKPPPGAERDLYYYAMGLMVRPEPAGDNWWHGGLQPGVLTFAAHASSGYAYAAMFNSFPQGRVPALTAALDAAMFEAARTARWPEGEIAGD